MKIEMTFTIELPNGTPTSKIIEVAEHLRTLGLEDEIQITNKVSYEVIHE